MDGRTLYSPLYAGVEWDVQDTMLEDIDRIEIIRGPGAALWGANAVNGVINIITKPAADTQGGLVAYHVGTFEKGSIAARYGGAIGENGPLPRVLEVLRPAEPAGCRRNDAVWRMEEPSPGRPAGLVADQDRHDHAQRRVVAQQPPRARRRDHLVHAAVRVRGRGARQDHDRLPADAVDSQAEQRVAVRCPVLLRPQPPVRRAGPRQGRIHRHDRRRVQPSPEACAGGTTSSGAAVSGRCGTGSCPPSTARSRRCRTPPAPTTGSCRTRLLCGATRSGSRSARSSSGTRFRRPRSSRRPALLWAPAQRHTCLDGGLPRGAGALAQRARPGRARLDLRERGRRGGIRTARGLAGIQARETDVVRGGLPFRAREAVFARRGVVLQRLRRSADDRDGRRRSSRRHRSPA